MPTIDLHGIKHENVTRLLDEFIWDNLKIGTESVLVITGKSEEMKRLVREVASEYYLTTKEGLSNTGEMTINLV